MKNILTLLLFACAASGLTSCQSIPGEATGLTKINKFTVPEKSSEEIKNRLALVNHQIDRHDSLVGHANKVMTQLDGRQRGFSWAAVGTQGFLGLSGIATSALTAAAPAANATWIQGLTATTAGANMVRTEMHAQQLSAVAYRESLRLTALDIIEAQKLLKFDVAYACAISETGEGFNAAISENAVALMKLEQAVVLKPLTHTIQVKEDNSKPQTKG